FLKNLEQFFEICDKSTYFSTSDHSEVDEDSHSDEESENTSNKESENTNDEETIPNNSNTTLLVTLKNLIKKLKEYCT
ncbi:14317_t:CDS:1, partial [Racocetra fulgida]